MSVHLHDLIDVSRTNDGVVPYVSDNIKYALLEGMPLKAISMAHSGILAVADMMRKVLAR